MTLAGVKVRSSNWHEAGGIAIVMLESILLNVYGTPVLTMIHRHIYATFTLKPETHTHP